MDRQRLKEQVMTKKEVNELTQIFDAELIASGKMLLTLKTANGILKSYEKFELLDLEMLLEKGELPQAYKSESTPQQWYIQFSKPAKYKTLRKKYLENSKFEAPSIAKIHIGENQNNSPNHVHAGEIQTTSPKYMLVGIAVLLFMFFGLYQRCGNPTDSSRADHSNGAFFTAKAYVRGELNYPEEASFDWSPILNRMESNNNYRIVGYVTGKNAFGVKIRVKYICVLHYLGGDDLKTSSWELISLDLNE